MMFRHVHRPLNSSRVGTIFYYHCPTTIDPSILVPHASQARFLPAVSQSHELKSMWHGPRWLNASASA